MACFHCNGEHGTEDRGLLTSCARVKAFEFYQSGDLKHVEYWPGWTNHQSPLGVVDSIMRRVFELHRFFVAKARPKTAKNLSR